MRMIPVFKPANASRVFFCICCFALLSLTFTSGLKSDQAGEGLKLPEVVVVGQDSVKLKGFRDFTLMPLIAPGTKLEPVDDVLALEASNTTSAPKWTTPEIKSPGCAYRNAVTAYMARGITGAAGFYRSGKQKYLDGAYHEARYYFSTGLEKYPDSPFVSSSSYWLGEIAFHDQQMKAAHAYFSRVTADPGCQYLGYAYYSLGWLEHQAGKYALAADSFAVIATLDNFKNLQPTALFWHGESLLRAKKFEQSEVVLQNLLQKYPASPYVSQARYLLASMLINRQDYQTALDYLNAILTVHANLQVSDVLLRQSLLAAGWCHYYLQQYQQAIYRFQPLLLPEAPEDTRSLAFLGYGLSLIRDGRVQEALDFVGKQPDTVRQDRVSAVVLREIIVWDDAHEKSSDAIMAAHLLLEESPEKFLVADDFRQLAWRYEKKDAYDAALEVVERGIRVVLENGGSETALLIEKARILQLLNRVGEAEKILDEVLNQPEQQVSGEQKNQCRLLLARGYNATGSYVSALTILDAIPVDSQQPESVLAAYERGWARMGLEAYEKALSEFDFFLAHQARVAELVDSKNIQNAMINKGECLFNLRRDEMAATTFKKFIQHFPASPFVDRARYYLAWIDLRQEKYQLALDKLSAILRDYPDTELQDAIYYQRGQAYFSMGHFIEAVGEYEFLVEHYPESSFAGRSLLKIGESYFNAQDYLRARLVYLRAARTYPDTSIEERSRYGLLMLAYKQRHDDYLETEAAVFMEKFPRSVYLSPLVMMVADIYRQHKQWDELQSMLSTVISGQYPDEVKMDALYQMISLAREKQDEQQTIDWCRKMVKQFPGGKYQCDCNLIFAQRAFKQGDYGKTLDLLDDSLTVCSDKHLQRQSLLLDARANERLNQPGMAEKLYKKIISQEYQDSVTFLALDALGGLKKRLHQYEQAEFFYQQAARNPKHELAAAAQYNRAVVLQKAGKKSDAIKQYLRLSYLFPEQESWIVKALCMAAELYEQDHKTAAAKKTYQKLLQYHLSEQQLEQVKKSLAALKKED